MTLLARMKADLTASMKARDHVRVATLRTMIAALDNAGAVAVDTHHVPLTGLTPDVPRRELSDQEQLAILRGEADSRRAAIVRYAQLGQDEVAARLQLELAILADYC